MKRFLHLFLLFLPFLTLAQENEKKFDIKPYGFIGVDAMIDTRASALARYNHVYLYPLPPKYDADGNDINDNAKYDLSAAITRVGFKISGPDAFGAKTSAIIEGDFAGYGKSKDFMVRLRHAVVKLDWSKSQLLVGQYWHPFFVTENFPATVNFVVGSPVHPISRTPQVRFTYKQAENFSISLSALSQGDFTNSGAAEQVEMADIPEFNLQLKYGNPKSFFIATTVGVKQVRPMDVDGNNLINKNKVTSFQSNLSIRYTTPLLTYKLEGIYGGNLTNMVMLGGIARKTNSTSVNPVYVPINTSALWTDIHTNKEKVNIGIFSGITYNLGTSEKSDVKSDASYTRGSDIGYIYHVAPRVTMKSGPITVGLEWMYTVAAYGKNLDEYSKPKDLDEYHNNRITLGLRYNF